jgi:hypothetical protein
MPELPRNGDMAKDWGLRVMEPFHIKSGLGLGRYLDIIGRNMVIKTPNERRTQFWYFDYKTRTIKNW